MLSDTDQRSSVRSGTLIVGAGLISSGVLTYGYLMLARRSLTAPEYSAFAVLWGLTLIVGPGLFQPLEQEITRATAQRTVMGQGTRPLVRRAAFLGAFATIAVCGLITLAWPLGLNHLLDGRSSLYFALIASFATFMVAEVVRGVLGGHQQFAGYSRSLAVEGATRCVGAVVIVVVGLSMPGFFGLVLALSYLLAALAVAPAARSSLHEGPPASFRDLTPKLGVLIVISCSEAFLLNIGPAAVAAISDDPAAPGRFLNALVIARLPLFVFQAVKVSLLPAVSARAAVGDLWGVRRTMTTLLSLTCALVAVAALGAFFVGPFLVDILFADSVAGTDMGALALANGLAMIITAFSITLIGMGVARTAAACWLVGVAAFGCALLLDIEPLARVELAMIVGMTITAALMCWSLRPVWRAKDLPTP